MKLLSDANVAGRKAWRKLISENEACLEFPNVNPYGDEFDNKQAQDFRKGFDTAARIDGYTYSDLDGEYHEGGEYETDEFEQID